MSLPSLSLHELINLCKVSFFAAFSATVAVFTTVKQLEKVPVLKKVFDLAYRNSTLKGIIEGFLPSLVLNVSILLDAGQQRVF